MKRFGDETDHSRWHEFIIIRVLWVPPSPRWEPVSGGIGKDGSNGVESSSRRCTQRRQVSISTPRTSSRRVETSASAKDGMFGSYKHSIAGIWREQGGRRKRIPLERIQITSANFQGISGEPWLRKIRMTLWSLWRTLRTGTWNSRFRWLGVAT